MLVNENVKDRRIAELTATCKEQGKRIAELEVDIGVWQRGRDTWKQHTDCQVKLKKTAEAELAKLRKSKDLCPVCLTWSWAPCDEGVLCQCCNDSRIAVLWKGRAEELRKACRLALSKSDRVNIRRRVWQGILLDVRAILEAALAKGDEK